MLEPWAQISQRLRRVHPNLKLTHSKTAASLTINFGHPYYSRAHASSGSNYYSTNCWQSYYSLLAGDDLFCRGRDLSGFAHRPGQVFKTNQVREGQDAAVRVRHRSDDRGTRALHGALLYRRDVVPDFRRRDDLSAAVGDNFYG